jgi:diguanylate cyclase (GGDEF)-like protein
MQRPFQVLDNRQLDTLRVFHEVARALTSSLDLPAILRTIMQQMEEFFGPERWSLLLVDEEKEELYFALSAGLDEDSLRDGRIKLGEGVSGHVALTGKPLVVPDIQKEEPWKRFAAANPKLHLQSIACLPIQHGNTTLGVLQLHNSKIDLLPENSISFLRVLCDYTAIALQNARQVKLIHQLTITDDCTGLFNARHLYDLLGQEIARRSTQRHFSLLFFDLDRFKTINDTYGHLAGSKLLSEMGTLLRRMLGTEHAGFRYGGDEFVVLLRALNRPAAFALANTLRSALKETEFLRSEGRVVRMTASFGLACFPENGDTLQGLIRAADSMMYHAKEEGRDRICVASGNLAEMPQRHNSRH